MSIQHKLPSGALLEITIAPFEDAQELYQMVAGELLSVDIKADDEINVNMFKNLFCVFLSSKKIKEAIDLCAKRCVYNKERIDSDTFEEVDRRQDYIECMAMIAWENIHPFGKALFAQYKEVFGRVMTMGQE